MLGHALLTVAAVYAAPVLVVAQAVVAAAGAGFVLAAHANEELMPKKAYL